MRKSLADKIEQYIKVLIERSEDQSIEIQRAELAETFNCVPSQVTYVINTRFNESEGYLAESRRGGKGYVRITKFISEDDSSVQLSREQLLDFVKELCDRKEISVNEYELLKHLIIYAFNDLRPREKRRLFQSISNALKEFVK